MKLLRLNSYWEVVPIGKQIQFRSPGSSFSIRLENEDIPQILAKSLQTLTLGTTLADICEGTGFDEGDVSRLIAVLENQGAITARNGVAPSRRSSSLADMVRSTGSINENIILHLPESGGVKKSHAITGQMSNNQLLVYGFRYEDRYYLCGYNGSDTWLEPTRFARETMRSLLNQEDLPYAWLIVESDKWPSPEYYFPHDQAVVISQVICEVLPQIAGSAWEITPAGFERIQPMIGRGIAENHKATSLLTRLETEFVGSRSIIFGYDSVKIDIGKPGQHFFVGRSRAAIPHLSPDGTDAVIWSWGEDDSAGMSEIKAIMEGLERYSSGCYDLDSLQFGSIGTVGRDAIHPRELCLYEPFPSGQNVGRFEEDQEIHWRQMVSVEGKESKLIPVDYVYYPLSRQELGRDPFFFSTSSGVAAHISREIATDSALAELCEREAVMVHWYNQTSPPAIALESLSDAQRERIAWLEELGYKTRILDMRLDLIPVVMAIAIGEKGKRALTIGASASGSYDIAVQKAIGEISTVIALDDRDGVERVPIDKFHVDSPEDHGKFYSFHENLCAIDCWLANDSEISLPSGNWKVRDSLKEAHLTAYTLDLTPEEVRQSELSVSVIRAIVPGMVPINFGYGLHPLGLRRLRAVAKKAQIEQGLVCNPDALSSDAIHPFS
ncbi:MAG: YcaO-like family protein [bacterium]|nr:YcaO-like family protein [bacterium]